MPASFRVLSAVCARLAASRSIRATSATGAMAWSPVPTASLNASMPREVPESNADDPLFLTVWALPIRLAQQLDVVVSERMANLLAWWRALVLPLFARMRW